MRFYASIRHEAFQWQFLRSPRFWWQLFRFSGRQSVSKIKTVRFGLHSLCKVVDGKKMNPILRFLLKLKPGVQKIWLQLLAGLIWFGVGLMLIRFASNWLIPVSLSSRLLLVLAGLLLATGIYLFGFSKLAKKNILRINGLKGKKICLFAFQGWTSYPLVVFMIFLGIFLRTNSIFPKPLLAILYLGIGGGILSASLHYFATIRRTMLAKPA